MSDTSNVDPAALVLGANKSYGFYPGWVPDSDHWNFMFSHKVDDEEGILINPSVVGNLTLDRSPTDPRHAVPRSYVDGLLGGSGGGMPDAPSDGTPYCRLNGAWSPAPTTLTPNVTGDLTVTGGLAVWDDATFNGALGIGTGFAMFGATPPAVQPSFTGAKGGNTALASVIAVLVAMGVALDTTSA